MLCYWDGSTTLKIQMQGTCRSANPPLPDLPQFLHDHDDNTRDQALSCIPTQFTNNLLLPRNIHGTQSSSDRDSDYVEPCI